MTSGQPSIPHVLIVSDDRDVQTFFSEGLTLAGFWTSVVASALQTLEVFRLRSFDLVLIDDALSGLSAPELIRRLRGSSPLAGQTRTDVPIVLLVDDPNVGADRAALLEDVTEIIAPPIELEILASRLQRLVNDWRAAHPDQAATEPRANQ
jgi:CheY-like chemotaxis protein